MQKGSFFAVPEIEPRFSGLPACSIFGGKQDGKELRMAERRSCNLPPECLQVRHVGTFYGWKFKKCENG